MAYKVQFACKLMPEGDGRFIVVRRRGPGAKLAAILHKPKGGRKFGDGGEWAVETMDGAPFGERRFGCRQTAYRHFVARGGALARAEVQRAARNDPAIEIPENLAQGETVR